MKKTIYAPPSPAKLTWLLLLVFTTGAARLFAQCNVANVYTTGTITGGTDVAQSFTTLSACGDGDLTDITVWATGSHTTVHLYVYEGNGCGGTQIHFQNTGTDINANGLPLPTTIDLVPDVPFTAGNTYTFRLIYTDPGSAFFTLLRGTTNAYSGGNFLLSCVPNTSEDLFFIAHTNSILPVELTAFDAILQENQTHLAWRTASEKDNAGFEIERSNDATTWQTLALVPGNGTTNEPQAYFFKDENPLPGDNYYRLKQLDFSGAAEYSDVRHVRLASGKMEDVSVSPNPVQAGQTLTVFIPLEGAGGGGTSVESAQLVDALGRIVWEGGQFEGEKMEISLPPDLSKGLCWLVLTGGREQVARKVLVQ